VSKDVQTGRPPLDDAAAVPPPSIAQIANPRAAITLQNVSKYFSSRKGEVHAVDNVSLTIQAGEFVSIVGPSGCGKSTLLGMIAGLMSPSTGTVEVSGRPVKGPVHELGVVFQQHLLLGWRTILNNVLLPDRGSPSQESRLSESRRRIAGARWSC